MQSTSHHDRDPVRPPTACPSVVEVSRDQSPVIEPRSSSGRPRTPGVDRRRRSRPPSRSRPRRHAKPSTEKAIFFASDGMRPDLVDRYVGRGGHADLRRNVGAGVKGANGTEAGVPAEHRRRLVHAGDRNVAGRARVDEQHLPPDGRGQLQQPHEPGGLDPPGRHDPASRRAGGQEGRVRRVGRIADPQPRRAGRSTSGTSSRAAASLRRR